MKLLGMAVAMVFLAIISSGCGSSPHQSPKMITADDEHFVSCDGLLWVGEDSGGWGGATSYNITFYDVLGKKHDIRGIRKLSVEDAEVMLCIIRGENSGDTWTGKTPKGVTVYSTDGGSHWVSSDNQAYTANDY